MSDTKPEEKKDTNVCQNQESFNDAFQQAINTYPKKEYDQLTSTQKTSIMIQRIIYIVLGLIFIVWAVMLAQKSNDKTLHTLLAIIFSPLYILSYYISITMKKK
jgi:Ca2+/Na+ antiporter